VSESENDSPEVPPEPRVAILCVEDDRLMAVAIQRALRDYDVVVADRAAIARELISSRTFAAWLIDVAVPDGSGVDLLAWARERGWNTPALVMTGHADREAVNAAQSLGAEFLYKPYNKANLMAFLGRALRDPGGPALSARAKRFAEEHGLTSREADVLVAMARGVSRVKIAAELGVKENTVKTMIRRLLRRTEYGSVGDILRALLREDR
jgi:DNA-binding NarL/FixJ family response regulator